MGNIQGVWILYIIVLILNFLMVNKPGTATESHGIKRETDKIYQPKYFKNALILKQKFKFIYEMELNRCIALEKGFGFCLHRKQEGMDLFQVRMDQILSRSTSRTLTDNIYQQRL